MYKGLYFCCLSQTSFCSMSFVFFFFFPSFLPAIDMKIKSQRREIFLWDIQIPVYFWVRATENSCSFRKEKKKQTTNPQTTTHFLILRVYFYGCSVNIQYLQCKCPVQQCKYSMQNQNRCSSQMFSNEKEFKQFSGALKRLHYS